MPPTSLSGMGGGVLRRALTANPIASKGASSVTDAVRQALRAELERCPNPERPEAIEARKAAIRAICARTSTHPEWQGRTSKELQDALYDEDGLPV